MFNRASFRVADATVDLKAIARSARGRSLPDPGELVRRADVPRRIDAAVDATSSAVRDAIRRLPGQRRRRRRLPLLVAGLSVAVLATAGVVAWAMRRRAADAAARVRTTEDHEFDRDALDRAADDGMGVAATGNDGRPGSNGEVRELSSIGDLV
jgi:hypothetical protein